MRSGEHPDFTVQRSIPCALLYPLREYVIEQMRACCRQGKSALATPHPATREQRLRTAQILAISAKTLFAEIIGYAEADNLPDSLLGDSAIAVEFG